MGIHDTISAVEMSKGLKYIDVVANRTKAIVDRHNERAPNSESKEETRWDVYQCISYNFEPFSPGPPFAKVAPICTKSAVPIVPTIYPSAKESAAACRMVVTYPRYQ